MEEIPRAFGHLKKGRKRLRQAGRERSAAAQMVPEEIKGRLAELRWSMKRSKGGQQEEGNVTTTGWQRTSGSGLR
jgi:hypothetical protein